MSACLRGYIGCLAIICGLVGCAEQNHPADFQDKPSVRWELTPAMSNGQTDWVWRQVAFDPEDLRQSASRSEDLGDISTSRSDDGHSPVNGAEGDRIASVPKKGTRRKTLDSFVADGKKPAVGGANDELGDYKNWPKPDVALFVTGQQHGYIEPCGCTGLDKQKGGVARRMTMMKQLLGRGWNLVPVDSGNQVRRNVPQASIKLQWSSDALNQMKYQLVGFGPDDMRLRELDLLQVAMADSPETAMYVSANVTLLDPTAMPTYKVVSRGKHKIGLTSVLDPKSVTAQLSEDVTISDPAKAASTALKGMNAEGATFRVLSFFGTEKTNEEDAQALMQKVSGYDLIIASGGYGEPTYQPQKIENSKCKMILTGNKGMYVGLVGLYSDGGGLRYARVPLSHEFSDAKEMRQLMKDYQEQLKQLGLNGLGLSPFPHANGSQFVGSKACKECHEFAYDIWENSDHFLATKHIVEPTDDRGDVARHFDPECLSCHVTGWVPERYHPYESGFLSLESGAHLKGNGCENCHGPGKHHVDAENGKSEAAKLKWRKEMELPLEKARDHCMKCHDLDNSPEFGEDGAFEDEYWPQIDHTE